MLKRSIVSIAMGLLWLMPGAATRAQSGLVLEFAGATVLLTSGDTLRGALRLHYGLDLLEMALPNKTIRTLPAGQVRVLAARAQVASNLPQPRTDEAVEWRNPYFMGTPANYQSQPRFTRPTSPDTTRVRVFQVLPWDRGRSSSAALAAPAFFEQLTSGRVVLLRRQVLVEYSQPLSEVSAAPQLVGYRPGQPAYPSPSTRWRTTTESRDQLYLAVADAPLLAVRRCRAEVLRCFGSHATALEQYARLHQLRFDDTTDLAQLISYANAQGW